MNRAQYWWNLFKTMTMSNEVRQWSEKLERQKSALLSDVASLGAEQIWFRPEPSSWSVADVLDHLVKVEQASLEAVRRQLPGDAPPALGDRMRAAIVILVMRSPVRVKVPASATQVLPEAADPAKSEPRWSEVRKEMGDLLRSLQPEQLRHPVSGWMTMAQALAFLSAHLRHHRYQIDRLKSASRTV